MFFFIDCDCFKVKLWLDGKEVIDFECDVIGECFCLFVFGVFKVIFMDGGCVFDCRL